MEKARTSIRLSAIDAISVPQSRPSLIRSESPSTSSPPWHKNYFAPLHRGPLPRAHACDLCWIFRQFPPADKRDKVCGIERKTLSYEVTCSSKRLACLRGERPPSELFGGSGRTERDACCSWPTRTNARGMAWHATIRAGYQRTGTARPDRDGRTRITGHPCRLRQACHGLGATKGSVDQWSAHRGCQPGVCGKVVVATNRAFPDRLARHGCAFGHQSQTGRFRCPAHRCRSALWHRKLARFSGRKIDE